MAGLTKFVRIALMSLSLAAGCVAPKPMPTASGPVAPSTDATTQAAGSPRATLPGGPVQQASHQTAPGASRGPGAPQAASPQAIGDIISDLRKSGLLDAESERRLVSDLQKTEPSLWPLLLQSFRASLAYKERARTKQTSLAKHPAHDEKRRQLAEGTDNAAGKPLPSDTALAVASDSPELPAPQQAATQQAATQSPIQQASHQVPNASPFGNSVPTDAWQQHLAAAIAGLEAATQQSVRTPEEAQLHAQLRMLYLAAGRRDDALRPISGIAPVQQDFWLKELYGLSTFLDCQRTPDQARRATEAATHLNEAKARLAELGTLLVRNLAFCNKVDSYGVYNKVDTGDLKPGQRVLLYAEVENYKSEQTKMGFHTALKSSYQILDVQGRRVVDGEFDLAEEFCQNPRRDYFLPYALDLPERLYDGTYTLQMTVEDTLGQKIGQSTLDFTVKSK